MGSCREDMSTDRKLTEYEKQKLKLDRLKLLAMIAALEQQQAAYRRANRSFMDKVDDFLFGW